MTGAAFEARVVATFGHRLLVAGSDGRILPATRRGRRGDVVTGDRVTCHAAGAHDAVIEAVLPRRSLFFRADAHRTKALAANVDQVAVVFAPRPAPSEGFLWRACVAATAAGVTPLAVLNKTDLGVDDGLAAILGRLAQLGVRALAVSARTDPERARQALAAELAGRCTLLVGQSGMGKSTLLNLMVPDAQARTQAISHRLDLGRQTTTSSRWFPLDPAGEAALVDSPGFLAFGLAHLAPDEVMAAMPDLAAHAGNCRFADCRHDREPDCALQAAVRSGAVAAERLAFLHELAAEHAR